MPAERDTYEADIEDGIDAAEDLMAQALDLAAEQAGRPGFTSGVATALCGAAGMLVARLDPRCRADIIRSLAKMLEGAAEAAGERQPDRASWYGRVGIA